MSRQFWKDEEMKPLLKEFNQSYKQGQVQRMNEIYPQIHKQFERLVEVVMLRIISLNNFDRFDKDAIISRCFEKLTQTFNPDSKGSSLGYFYSVCRTYIMNAFSGRSQCGAYPRARNQQRTLTITSDAFSEHFEGNDEALHQWIVQQVGSDDWNVKTIERNQQGETKVRLKRQIREKRNVDYVDEDGAWRSILDDQHATQWNRNLADLIDFQILSEYVPDTDGSNRVKQIAYGLIEMLEIALDNGCSDFASKIDRYVVIDVLKSRGLIGFEEIEYVLAFGCLQQAFGWYREDELIECEGELWTWIPNN